MKNWFLQKFLLLCFCGLYSAASFAKHDWFIDAEIDRARMHLLFLFGMLKTDGTLEGTERDVNNLRKLRDVLTVFQHAMEAQLDENKTNEVRAQLRDLSENILKVENLKNLGLVDESEIGILNQVLEDYGRMLRDLDFPDNEEREMRVRIDAEKFLQRFTAAEKNTKPTLKDYLEFILILRVNAINSKNIETLIDQEQREASESLKTGVRKVATSLAAAAGIFTTGLAWMFVEFFANPFNFHASEVLGRSVSAVGPILIGIVPIVYFVVYSNSVTAKVAGPSVQSELESLIQGNYLETSRIFKDKILDRANQLNVDLRDASSPLADFFNTLSLLDHSRYPCFQTLPASGNTPQ